MLATAAACVNVKTWRSDAEAGPERETLALADAQLQIARSEGFEIWSRLVKTNSLQNGASAAPSQNR